MNLPAHKFEKYLNPYMLAELQLGSFESEVVKSLGLSREQALNYINELDHVLDHL